MKKETTCKYLNVCFVILFSSTSIFANNSSFNTLNTMDVFFEYNTYRIATDSMDCDDLDCTNGVETWNPVTCECESGIPPSPCSACYDQEEGTSCDNGDTNTFNDTWQEVMPDIMRYRVEVNCTWDSLSPGWPDRNAHFSWMGGGIHTADVKFWEVGTLASPGIDRMSVNGVTTLLATEVEAQIALGNALSVIQEQHWFCPDGIIHPSCGELSFEITVSQQFPLVTMASMLGPSPDWFIGMESLSTVDTNGVFIPRIIHELYPYDAGILSDNSVLEEDCCAREPLSVPQQNIHLITEESGELIGPGSLGQIILTAIPEPYNCVCVSDPDGLDNDGDGFIAHEDCDDNNGSINPGQTEIPYNGLDDDCNAATLDDDLDQDGFIANEDCDDDNASINPDQTEVPYNGLDDDCDATTLDDDLDQDGFTFDVDCDDDNALINPDAEEIPNNDIDEDCDGSDLITSIHQISNATINIYPNPVSTKLQIQIDVPLNYQISIFDLNGALILKETNKASINVNQLSNGIYLLEILDDKTKEKIVEKILVAR